MTGPGFRAPTSGGSFLSVRSKAPELIWRAGGDVEVVSSAASAAGQAGKTALLNKIAQMTRGGGFRDLGHCLVLRGADAVLETSLTAIEQTVKHFDLLSG